MDAAIEKSAMRKIYLRLLPFAAATKGGKAKKEDFLII